MKRAIAPILVTAFIFTGTQALADDSTSSSSMTQHHQMMKDCMAKQKAMDSSMSAADMKKACKDQMNMQKSGMDSTKTNPADPTTDKNIGTASSAQK